MSKYLLFVTEDNKIIIRKSLYSTKEKSEKDLIHVKNVQLTGHKMALSEVCDTYEYALAKGRAYINAHPKSFISRLKAIIEWL